VAPLEEFIDNRADPREHYVDLQEIAEGESGSVYIARVVKGHKLSFPKTISSKSSSSVDGSPEYVAIKNVPISPSGSPKLIDLERELKLLRGVQHENVLGMDALYVDLLEDSLWIRMELMERSLADVVALVGEGLMVQERMIARFASDVSL
jgi:serine/threonine-protein kinase CLA4